MAEVFVVGSVTWDLVLKVERRPEPGETVTDAVLSLHDGGKGANQAAAAALLGASVVFLGRVGDDGLGEPLRALSERGVDTDLSGTVEGYSTGAALITVTSDGENAITVASGANHTLSPRDVDAVADAVREASVLVMQMEIPHRVVERAAELAHGRGTRVLLNLAPPFRVPGSLLERLDPLMVNEHEAAFLIGEKVEGVDGALSAAPELLRLGPLSVAITLGPAGAVVAEKGGEAAHLPPSRGWRSWAPRASGTPSWGHSPRAWPEEPHSKRSPPTPSGRGPLR